MFTAIPYEGVEACERDCRVVVSSGFTKRCVVVFVSVNEQDPRVLLYVP